MMEPCGKDGMMEPSGKDHMMEPSGKDGMMEPSDKDGMIPRPDSCFTPSNEADLGYVRLVWCQNECQRSHDRVINIRSIIIMASVSPLYEGSRLLLSVSEKTGVTLDQVNFVAAQFSALLFGFILRYCLPHSLGKPLWRSLFCLITGLLLLYFTIGCPLMITTQKITTLAFSLSDWKQYQKGEKMPEERLKWSVQKMPSFLEYFAFTLSFQGILAGPFCHYKLYRAFIEGNTKERLQECKHAVEYMDAPSSVRRAVVTKIAAVFMWIFVTAVIQPKFPDRRNVEPDFIANNNMITRVGYLYISLFFQRAKYYVSWILADAVYNASGLGYVGNDKDGKPMWTGMSNVFVWKIETATSLKVYLDNWNILTTHWLRHVCYMRAPFLNLLLTFSLSALWHGLFVGYYITFVSAAFFVQAGRKIRQNIRPLFQTSKASKFVYEVLTFLGTQLSLCFLVLSFVVLHWEPTIRFHSSFYWCCHIIVGLLVIVLPSKRSAREDGQSPHEDNNIKVQRASQDSMKDQEEVLADGDFKPRKREVMSVQKS
ncbi:Lysophospholipid acyltransferase 2 [Bulinus truncatus]|nr:Lysophospholipid acyltransferase 2 [Bulinus truncatus]